MHFSFYERKIQLRTQLQAVISLQKIDIEIAKKNNRKKILPLELAKLEEAFQAECAVFEKDKRTLEELIKLHRDCEEKLKRGMEGLKKTKDRLTEVKTNKEYQAMLKEIELAEAKNASLEDEILVIMDKLDQARKIFKSREKDMETYRSNYEIKKRSLEQEAGELDVQIAAYAEKYQHLKEQVAPDLFKRYETIKNRRQGVAVVAAWKETCFGCHMNIPPQLYIELQKSDDTKYCPHCNRIIYWEDKNNKGS